MASIISADNGSISGSAGLKSTADSSGILQLQTGANTNALLIDASQYPSATINGLGQGVIPAQQLYRLNSTLAGANATSAQSVLGVGVTLVGSTVYQFELVYCITKSAGTTSHTVGVSFGGTATLNNIGFSVVYAQSATTGAVNGQPASGSIQFYITQATNTVITPSITTAAQAVYPVIRGTVSVNTGGTFIPQYTLSAAPGGAYTAQPGSYFKISPLGASGANTSIGSWV